MDLQRRVRQQEAGSLALQRPKDPNHAERLARGRAAVIPRRGRPPAGGPPSCRAQPFGRQFLGLGSSIRLVASAGTSEATTVTRSTLPSLRTTCTSPPESTK